MRLALRVFVLLLAVFLEVPQLGAQSVSCPEINFSAGSTLTLPCGPPPGCTTLTATLPDIRSTTAYTIDSIPYSGHFPFTIAGATPVSVGTDDVYSPAIALPFPFCYYGTSYSSCVVGSNGIISFDPTLASGYCDWVIEDLLFGVPLPLPDAIEHDVNAIFAVFHDIDPSIPSLPGAGVEYAVTGTAPCRKLIVNFRDIAHYSDFGECDTLRSTFQIVLFENTNVIEVYIKDKPVCSSSNGGLAILGLHNATGTAAVTIPGKNATVWGDTAYNKAYRFIPNGTSLLSSVTLLSSTGALLGTGTTTVSAPGELTATFPSVCVTDSGTFIAKADYVPCSGTALTATDTIKIILPAGPAAPAVTSPVAVCQGAPPVTLSATGTSLLWYTTATGGTGSPTAPTPSTATAGTFTHYVSQTAGGCEGPRAAITVNVIPSGSFTATGAICPGGTINFGGTVITAPGSYTVTFASASGCDSIVTLNVLPAPFVTGNISDSICDGESYFFNGMYLTAAGTYIDTLIASTGCDSILTLNLSVITTPPPAVVSPITYCLDYPTVPLSATGSNLLWYTTATGGTGSATPPTPSSAAAGVSNYYVSQTAGSCESPRAMITVIVTDELDPPLVTSPIQYCGGTPATPLNATGTNLLWYTDPIIPGSGSPVAPTPSTASPGITLYHVTQSANGCVSQPATIQVVVTPAVEVDISISQNPVCQNVTSQVTAIGVLPPGAAYVWNWDGAIPLSGTGAGPYEVQWPRQGVFRLRVAAEADNCFDTAALEVVVNPAPAIQFAAPERACVGDEITVAAIESTTGIDEDSLSWDFAGAETLNGYGGGPYLLRYDEPGVKLLTLTAIAGSCQSDPTTDTITVYPLPPASILPPAAAALCLGDTVRFQAADTAKGYQYTWLPSEAFLTNDTFQAIGYVQPLGYTLRVTDSVGCVAEDSLLLIGEACCRVLVPTAFSPNGDSKNDFFRTITRGQHTSFDLRVYNRWGAVVFETGSQDMWWDGTYQGVRQDIGVYFWRLKYRCANGRYEEMEGEITLVR